MTMTILYNKLLKNTYLLPIYLIIGIIYIITYIISTPMSQFDHFYETVYSTLLFRLNDLNHIKDAIQKTFNESNETFIKSNRYNTKLLQHPNGKTMYLFIEEKQNIAVYTSEKTSYNKTPFEHSKDSITENKDLYLGNRVCELTMNQTDKKSPMAKIAKLIKKIQKKSNIEESYPIIQKIKELASIVQNRPKEHISDSLYSLKDFFQFLQIDNHFTDEHIMSLNSTANQHVKKELPELNISLNFIKDCMQKHNISATKKYIWNDHDNKAFPTKNGIVLENQNLGFYCEKTDDHNMQIYCYNIMADNSKSNNSLKSLLKNITEDGDNLINHTALKIKDGEVVFSDPALLSNFFFHVQFTKNVLAQEYKETPEYPIDIQSYEYQLAYNQKNYGLTEAEFVSHVLLTSGGGFDYDNIKGVFYDDHVTYSENTASYEIIEDVRPTKNLTYCNKPKNFTHLSPSWKKGIEYLIDVLKTDKPTFAVYSTKNPQKEVKDVIKKLEELLENAIIVKPKIPKNKL